MDKVDLWKKSLSLRKELGVDATSPIDIFTLSHMVKALTVVHYPMGSNLSGICIKGIGSNVIAINSSMTLGRQRFSMAHELYHLYFDDGDLTAICAKTIGNGSEKERQADQFASYLLMPPDALSEMISRFKKTSGGKLSLCNIIQIEQYFGVSRQAILYRLVDEKELSVQESDAMKQNVAASAVNLGYDDTLYKATPRDRQYKTFGYYIQQADEALAQGLISGGKYEELLLSAFRADLVYGDEDEGGGFID